MLRIKCMQVDNTVDTPEEFTGKDVGANCAICLSLCLSLNL